MSRRKNWPVIVADWKKSGLPVSQYCIDHGLNRTNFFAWKKKMERDDIKPEKTVKPVKSKKTESFVPVKFAPEKKAVSLSIRIGDSIRIEVEDNFDTPQLVRIVEALGSI